ncbi:translocation/assembly module TamB domain-containing protein [Haloferula rosea]|uniref:Translocation/assembly module TamB domain-containing protein n=1 Tax=Haloferula rosea TaxID=490093 RepID=A0A934VF51_9BACT|nr:translocation/assembly module TamB domain-containing protein [Haloferula rosea]MBK1826190.1 translocation/assembly module TamB domain-containing protein [Haloferula rosea]
MSEEETEKPPTPSARSKRPRWKKKRWWTLFVLIAVLVWLDGPGWRWLGQRVAQAYLPDLGYKAEFQLEGRLTSGPIRVVGLELSSDTVVHQASIDGLEVRYSLLDAIKGQVEAIEVNGLHVEVDLDAAPKEEEPEEEKEPLDLEKTLADIRGRLLPVDVSIENLSVTIRRGEELVYALEPTNLHHAPGSSDFRAELGEMTLPQDRRIPAQTPTITWEPSRIDVDELWLLEGVSLAEVSATIGQPADYSGSLFIGETRIDLTTDLTSIDLVMKGPPLPVAEVERIAKIEIPVDATLTALDATVTDFTGGIETLDAVIELGVSDFDYDGWSSEEITLKATLAEDRVEAKVTLAPEGSPLVLDATADIDRSNNFLPLRAAAEVSLSEIRSILTEVRDRFTPGEDRPMPPNGLIRISATTDFADAMPEDAVATVSIVPNEEAPPIQLKANWSPDVPIAGSLTLPGLKFDGGFDPKKVAYEGTAALDAFSPTSLEPWLLPFGIRLPTGMQGTLAWSGSGEVREVVHRGDLEIENFEWQNGDPEVNPLIEVVGKATYTWPESLELETLRLETGDQTFVAKAELANQTLRVEELVWKEGETPLASGTAEIPLPENPADWKALLKLERPIKVDLDTPDLALSTLHRFLPETVRFPDDSRGTLQIDLTGTPADPILDATLSATNVGLISQSEIPPADLKFVASAKEKTLKLDGEIMVPDYPKATINAVTSWEPKQWANDPETATQAPLDAELRVSNFNLEPFGAQIPGVRKASGMVNLVALVTGTVGEPKPKATISLEGGSLDWHQASKPDLNKAELSIEVTEEAAVIQNFTANLASGTIDMSGKVDLDAFKPAGFDLTVTGRALPVLRNDSMIVRASTDLKLSGPWESATLGGSIKIVDSLIYKDFEILPIGSPISPTAEPSLPSIDSDTPAEMLAAIPEPFKNWKLDLGLATSTPFLIRGNLAGGEIYLDARIGGTVGAPRPSGGAKLREVVAQLPFSALTIQSGTVTFNPDQPFNPRLNIKGESTVRPYQIDIYIYGSVSNPVIQPTSNPPLPEAEILTLIATGTTTEGLADPSAASARAAQLVIEEMRRGRIGAVKTLRPLFKLLDNVDFQVGEQEAYSSRTFNSVTFNLDENWLLTAGISEEGYSRAKVTYLLRFR